MINVRRLFMADISKEELLKFLDKVDAIADEMENHPELSNYYIGIIAQIRNINTAARTNVNKS